MAQRYFVRQRSALRKSRRRVTSLTIVACLDEPPGARQETTVVGSERRLILHRCGMRDDDTDAFENYEPHEDISYMFLIMRSGWVGQLRRLDASRDIHIGVVGDFRTLAPSPLQWTALVRLASLFGGLSCERCHVWAHSDVDRRHDDGDECPGSWLDIDRLRYAVRAANLDRLHAAGIEV